MGLTALKLRLTQFAHRFLKCELLLEVGQEVGHLAVTIVIFNAAVSNAVTFWRPAVRNLGLYVRYKLHSPTIELDGFIQSSILFFFYCFQEELSSLFFFCQFLPSLGIRCCFQQSTSCCSARSSLYSACAHPRGEFKHPLSPEHLELRLQVCFGRTFVLSIISCSGSIRMTIFLSFCHAGGPAGRVAGSPRPRQRSSRRVRCPLSAPTRLPQQDLAEFAVGEAHQAAAVTAGPADSSHLRRTGGRRGRAGAAAGAGDCGAPRAAEAERRQPERGPAGDGTRRRSCALQDLRRPRTEHARCRRRVPSAQPATDGADGQPGLALDPVSALVSPEADRRGRYLSDVSTELSAGP